MSSKLGEVKFKDLTEDQKHHVAVGLVLVCFLFAIYIAPILIYMRAVQTFFVGLVGIMLLLPAFVMIPIAWATVDSAINRLYPIIYRFTKSAERKKQ